MKLIQHPLVIAFKGILKRELLKFTNQTSRLAAAIVRPLIWLLVFGTGLKSILGVSILPPYDTYIPYPIYIIPGLLGMILLFNGMQTSLSMVYDREMGVMKILMTAPLPRSFILFTKMLAGTLISTLQVYLFLLVCTLFDYTVPWSGFLYVLPSVLAVGLMLCSMGLFLSSCVPQLENFAGVMNFVIFPAFFLSSSLYPLWRVLEGSEWIYWLALANPFTHAVELIRFSLYGELYPVGVAVVGGCFLFFWLLGTRGYQAQKGMSKRAIIA